MEKQYPERFLRGLRKPDYVIQSQDGSKLQISHQAFVPHFNALDDRTTKRNMSRHYETSINWEDDRVEALRILCNDTNNAKCGIACIPIDHLETLKKYNRRAQEHLEWEREPIKGNKFHGNLLFSAELEKPAVRELAAALACQVDVDLILIRPENYDSELADRTTHTTGTKESKLSGLWRAILTRLCALLRSLKS